jgi:RNA polymerase subunit RPABC4/transcription elongation factor Spt4
MQHTFAIIAAMLVAYLVALWFALAMWTFNDVRARSQNIVTQLLATVLVLGAGPFGLLLYYILRPQQTLVEAYEHSLEEETLLQEIENRHLCPTCNERVQDDFQVCPSCLTKLRRQCHFCNHLLAPEWSLCPYCGR